MPSRSAQNLNLVRGLFSGLAAPLSPTPNESRRCALVNPPERRLVLSEPCTNSAGSALFGQLTWTGLHGSDLPECRFRAVLDCGLFGGTPTKPSFWIHKRCGVDRESSPMTVSIPREPKGTSAIKRDTALSKQGNSDASKAIRAF